MDGATKFIRGDATVAVISVVVNDLAGLLIGIGHINWPSITNLHNSNHW
jgi:flagellar biosynthesis component FlhA